MIIAISGYARVGKDEAAKGLQAIGFQRVAFADKLREFLLKLDPIVGIREDSNEFNGINFVRVSAVVEKYGWDGYKSSLYGKEMRELMQRLGTQCGRELISDTIWIDAALNSAKSKDIVITDARFPNEAQAVKSRGGYVIRIERPGIEPVNPHPSEISLDDWSFDAVIQNDGNIIQLHSLVQSTYRHFKAVGVAKS